MKILKFILLVLFTHLIGIIVSQNNDSFKYQAIARDATGNVIAKRDISVRISLLQGAEEQEVFKETHFTTTNSFGLLNLNIGNGKKIKGSFSNINWAKGNISIMVEMDINGGNDFRLFGVSKLNSVPYAIYALNSGGRESRSGEWTNDGINIYSDSASFPDPNVGIGITMPQAKLHVKDTGFLNPTAPMILIQHKDGFSSTFRRNITGKGNALFLLQKSRGDIYNPNAVANGDHVGQIRMEAFDGLNYKTTAWIRSSVDGPISIDTIPGSLRFATTSPEGTVTERMHINSHGCVGVGTNIPQASLHVSGLNGLLATGEYGLGNNPSISGSGERLMWNPHKAAFRVGSVSGSNWDADTIGPYSVAMGNNTLATEYASTALGMNSKAIGEYSFALGRNTIASGISTMASGDSTMASGDFSTALGYQTIAESYASLVIGRYNETGSSDSLWVESDPIFEVGIGSSDTTRKNAFTIYKNGDATLLGNLTIGDTINYYVLPNIDGINGQVLCTDGNSNVTWESPEKGVFEERGNLVYNLNSDLTTSDFLFGSDTINHDNNSEHFSRMFFDKSKAAFRAGYVSDNFWNSDTIGIFSVAMGHNTISTGYSSIAIGDSTVASGDYSAALGKHSIASGKNALAAGDSTLATGDFATALGFRTKAISYAAVVIGRYNKSSSSATFWVEDDPIFEIGIGSSDTTRNNAFTVYKDGSAALLGNLTIGDTASYYILPKKDGDSDQVLTSDGNGTVSWQTPKEVVFERIGTTVYNMNGDLSTDDYLFGSDTINHVGNNDNYARIVFDKSQSSFRAGYQELDRWDESNMGHYSVAFGKNSQASADYSAAFGNTTVANSYLSFAIGRYNVGGSFSDLWINSDPIFEIGNGTSEGYRSNLFTVLKNGNVGIGTTITFNKVEVKGNIAGWTHKGYAFEGVNDFEIRTNAITRAVVKESSGYLGVGTTEPEVNFEVAGYGQMEALILKDANGTPWIINVDTNGLVNATRGFKICGDSVFDPRDGQFYNTTLIGNQCWFSENLNYGTIISSLVSQTNNGIVEKYCYADNPAYCDTLGGVYQWDEIMNHPVVIGTVRDICPAGWHVPSYVDWEYLKIALGSEYVAGGALKDTVNMWQSPNTGATNSSGFSALPGGAVLSLGFDKLGKDAYFWTSDMINNNSWYRRVTYNTTSLYDEMMSRYRGAYVRCIKND